MKLQFVPWLEEMIDHFWAQRNKILDEDFEIDYPDYGGLPRRISGKLSVDLVDAIQYELKQCLWNTHSKKEFAVQLMDVLSRGLIKVK